MTVSLLFAAAVLRQDFDAEKAWDTVSNRISQTYWAKETQGDKMSRLLEEAAPKAKSARTESAFNQAVDDMIAKFGDSHFDFLTRDDQGFYLFDGFRKGDKAAQMPNIGAWFKKASDGYIVQMVLNGGAAEAAGIRKGDLVLTVDNKPFAPVASFMGKVGQKVTLSYKPYKLDKTYGPSKSTTVEVTELPGQEMFLEATRKSGKIIEKGGKKIAYYHLWTMASAKFKDALEGFVYGKAKDTDAFILDIRDGFGGRPEGYGDPFFRPEANLEWTFSGNSTSLKQLFGYARPLIVIINPGSRSAKEVFSYIIKKSGRGVLVGDRTAGDVLGTSPSPIGEWAYIEIPMVDVKIDGQRLEHNPVQADYQLANEFDDSGKDLFLEKALTVAVEKSNAKR